MSLGNIVHFADQDFNNRRGAENPMDHESMHTAELKFQHFVQEWQENQVFIYREQLQKNVREGKHFLTVQLDHLMAFDELITMMLKRQPTNVVVAFERALQRVYQNMNLGEESGVAVAQMPKFQVQINSNENPKMLRDLQSNLMGQLVVVPGIITAASKTMIKANTIVLRCSNCQHEKRLDMKKGFAGTQLPRQCDQAKNPGADKAMCPLDPYRIIADKSDFMDQQRLKLQEAPELIPTGEMPRTFSMIVDRELCDKVTPGNRVIVVAILTIHSREGNDRDGRVNSSFLRVMGLQSQQNRKDVNSSVGGFSFPNITQEDEEKFIQLSKDPQLYEKLTKSIAPAIYGHQDIKKAICCLLFGGSAKKLPDGMRLRGDLNVLLLGDPSVAKSQFLKFVERVAPISVYTSGKGSSAAGLTAAVIKDNATGEFQLEGGAMVLADGGVVCIDEFDKMRPSDRVAIHEAMEQQTISIAKAGITTILNSRTSVLAAANPVYGRYDDLKHAAEQIDFQSSILSRFDCIFIVRDIREEAADKAIATHVVNLHMQRGSQLTEAEVDLEDLRKFLCYAKMKVFPRLSEEAAHMLQDMYVSDRMAAKEQQISKKTTGIPITVRQLEAIIRLSESIAKMHLQPIVTRHHVEEAHRLFRISTLNAAASGMQSSSAKETPAELAGLVQKIEEAIKRRVAIGTKIAYPKLSQELLNRFDNQRAIDYAIMAMVKRDEMVHRDARKILERKR